MIKALEFEELVVSNVVLAQDSTTLFFVVIGEIIAVLLIAVIAIYMRSSYRIHRHDRPI